MILHLSLPTGYLAEVKSMSAGPSRSVTDTLSRGASDHRSKEASPPRKAVSTTPTTSTSATKISKGSSPPRRKEESPRGHGHEGGADTGLGVKIFDLGRGGTERKGTTDTSSKIIVSKTSPRDKSTTLADMVPIRRISDPRLTDHIKHMAETFLSRALSPSKEVGPTTDHSSIVILQDEIESITREVNDARSRNYAEIMNIGDSLARKLDQLHDRDNSIALVLSFWMSSLAFNLKQITVSLPTLTYTSSLISFTSNIT